MSQQSLDELDEADWPDGLAEMVDSYLEADGAWTVDVRCETHPEYDGAATLSLEQCSVSDMQLNAMEGDACDDTTLLVHCSTGSISFAGWDLFEHAGSSASRMEYTDAVWTHWVASARLEESELRVSWTDGELSGLVEPVKGDFYCVLEGFEPHSPRRWGAAGSSSRRSSTTRSASSSHGYGPIKCRLGSSAGCYPLIPLLEAAPGLARSAPADPAR